MVEPPYGVAFNHDFPRPPKVHPEFQGSVPSRFMDRNSGNVPKKRMVETHNRSGFDGPCALGLGGYFTDVAGKVYQDKSIAKMANPGQTRNATRPWGDGEVVWRPGRHTGYHICKQEPDKLAYRPPFVARKGDFVLYHASQSLQTACDDVEVDRFRQQSAKLAAVKAKQKARQEDRQARAMVHGLENWEREHLGPARRNPAMTAGLGASASSPSLFAATGTRSLDNARHHMGSMSQQFTRPAAAY